MTRDGEMMRKNKDFLCEIVKIPFETICDQMWNALHPIYFSIRFLYPLELNWQTTSSVPSTVAFLEFLLCQTLS